MFILAKLKLNKFRDCAVPSNREYFQRFGFASPAATSFTGDDVAPEPMNKVEQMEDLQNYAEMKQREIDESNNSE